MSRRAVFIFVICAAPRLAALAVWPAGDGSYYSELAAGILRTGTLGFDGEPSTYMEPLYPAFLAAAHVLTGGWAPAMMLLQIAVASIGGVLMDRLGSHLAGRQVGFAAAALYALYPYLVRQSVADLEITICTTLAIATTLALVRTTGIRGAIGTGLCFGLLMLTRTSFVFAAVGAALWLASRPSTRLGAGGLPSTWLGAGRLAAVMAVTALAVLAPWFVRNIRVDGSPLPSRMGENLYVSTSAYAGALPVHDVDLMAPLMLADVQADVESLRLSPAQEARALDDAMRDRAMAFIREHPGQVLWMKARNALFLFTPLLLPRDAKTPTAFAAIDGAGVVVVNARRRPLIKDAAHAVAQAALLVLATLGIVRRRPAGPDLALLLMFGAQAAVCVVFFPTTRLLAPVMFVLMFYAAVRLQAPAQQHRPDREAGPDRAEQYEVAGLQAPLAARVSEGERNRTGRGVPVHL
jgi:hypothetical protein